MKFSKLTINGWKQFYEIDIEFHDRLTILTGANGSGKTTLLNLLARHFGWEFNELSTPIKDKSTGGINWIVSWVKRITGSSSESINSQINKDNKIGEIHYDNKTIAELSFKDNTNSPQYYIEIHPQQPIRGFNIISHRDIFRYQRIGNIPTSKRNQEQAFQIINNQNIQNSYGNNSKQTTNFFIKETLLSWAIMGSGNEYMEADLELKRYFDNFQEILKKLLPQSIGFEKITIRNWEIVLVTNTGDFMLDSVSGGIASVIDLAWQLYNFSNKDENFTVLIDEVENHLHPTMQRSILPDLLNAFPYVQFIVSSHSALVVGSVKDSHVYVFRYNEQNRVFSQQLDLVNKAKTATEILNEVLGIPFTMPIWAEKNLEELVSKYKGRELTEENIDEMRKEFKSKGLESLMPMAIKGIFTR